MNNLCFYNITCILTCTQILTVAGQLPCYPRVGRRPGGGGGGGGRGQCSPTATLHNQLVEGHIQISKLLTFQISLGLTLSPLTPAMSDPAESRPGSCSTAAPLPAGPGLGRSEWHAVRCLLFDVNWWKLSKW